MALDTNALVTLQTAKDFLKISGTADDAVLEGMINRASDAAEAFCRRPLKEKTLTNVRVMGPCHPRLPLLAVPVKASGTVTVTLDGTALTIWKTELDGDPGDFDAMLASYHPEGGRGPDHLYRAAGWAAGSEGQPYNVVITYTGGFATVPDDVQQACLYIVQRWFRDQQKQLTDVVAVQTAAGTISLLDTPLPRVVELLLLPYSLMAVAP